MPIRNGINIHLCTWWISIQVLRGGNYHLSLNGRDWNAYNANANANGPEWWCMRAHGALPCGLPHDKSYRGIDYLWTATSRVVLCDHGFAKRPKSMHSILRHCPSVRVRTANGQAAYPYLEPTEQIPVVSREPVDYWSRCVLLCRALDRQHHDKYNWHGRLNKTDRTGSHHWDVAKLLSNKSVESWNWSSHEMKSVQMMRAVELCQRIKWEEQQDSRFIFAICGLQQ